MISNYNTNSKNISSNSQHNKRYILALLISILILIQLACSISTITPTPTQPILTPTTTLSPTQTSIIKGLVPQSTVEPYPTAWEMTVNASPMGLNMREQPDESSTIIITIPHNTQIRVVLQMSNGWSFVDYGGRNGYVNSKYLK